MAQHTSEALWERLFSRENLLAALAKVQRNGGAPGVDGLTVEDLSNHLRAHWPSIRAKLMEDGMFCSTDRGRLWSPWNFGLLGMNVLALVISPDYTSHETVFVGTETRLFRSTNGGRAWRETGFDTDLAPSWVSLCRPILPMTGRCLRGRNPTASSTRLIGAIAGRR